MQQHNNAIHEDFEKRIQQHNITMHKNFETIKQQVERMQEQLNTILSIQQRDREAASLSRVNVLPRPEDIVLQFSEQYAPPVAQENDVKLKVISRDLLEINKASI